ncbi:MAG: hypothetical protein KJO78_03330 [Alphaproteobacteria bacterium]|jgi:hypothetical protein|nr:hypothetical protein [Alphaproteobacteria bacterium]
MTTAVQRSLGQRILSLVPILGAPARGADRTEETLLCAFIIFFALWGIAILTFGYPALILVALAMVPTAFVWLFVISWG